MRLRDTLLTPRPAAAARAETRAAIRAELLAHSRTLGGPMFKRLTVDDLRHLFALYDARCFGGSIGEALASPRGGPLELEVSRRMTRSGGITRRRVSRVAGATRQDFSIGISELLLRGTFAGEDRTISVCGVECHDRLDALMRIFEHELIHLCEFLVWGESNCSKRRFAGLVGGFFGHTEPTHRLVTPRERAYVEHGVRVGARVRFDAGRRALEGVVARIASKATVLVEDPDGEPYSDGRRYAKYYVPVPRLRAVD